MKSLEHLLMNAYFIRYHETIVQLLTQTLGPFFPIFIFKNDMQDKETITSNRRMEFPILG